MNTNSLKNSHLSANRSILQHKYAPCHPRTEQQTTTKHHRTTTKPTPKINADTIDNKPFLMNKYSCLLFYILFYSVIKIVEIAITTSVRRASLANAAATHRQRQRQRNK
ncbi:hypothetical protein AABD55_01200 [Edwardsiella piscicida]|uniref:hypothetical protein n=1 Tax=Edwardsiella piscicida TaxID=1263550 RepID=UPI00370DD13A